MIYVTVPTAGDLRDDLAINALRAEREFWEKRALELQRRLENLFEHAAATGHVQIIFRDKTLELYTHKEDE